MLKNITGKLLGMIIMIVVIIAFLVPSGMSMFGTPSVVATVGPDKIEYREYQQEMDRQQYYMGQFYGIKNFTQEQIEQLGLKNHALMSIFQRHWLNFFSEQMKIEASNDAVIKQIQQEPAFQKDGQFNLDIYKRVLEANHLTPKTFEENMRQQVSGQIRNALMARVPQSAALKQDLNTFAQERLKVDFVKFDLASLDKFIPISPAELKTFTSSAEGQKKIKAIFDQRKAAYDEPEQVRAHHILILAESDEDTSAAEDKINKIAKEVTPANFAKLAKKYSEDPGSNDKGGDLGLIRQGMMVPEFDNVAFSLPVGKISEVVKSPYGFHLILVTEKRPAKEAQLADYTQKIATELLQQAKRDEEQKLAANLTNQVKTALQNGQTEKLQALQKQYKFTYTKNSTINRLQGIPQLTLKENEFADLFTNIGKIFVFPGLDHVIIIKSSPAAKATKEEIAAAEKETENRQFYWARKLQEDVVSAMEGKYPAKVKNNINF